ncbi:MAG: hypothetical protein RBQ91_04895 [Acholeplasma sp.]|nr:hypothetical protein [Acholeplasma sp.]
MIYTLEKLKNECSLNGINLELDFKDRLENQTILYDINPVIVTGNVSFLTQRNLHFKLEVKTTVTLPCALTLKPVLHDLSFVIEEDVSDELDSEYRIINEKVDLAEIVWGALVCEIPLKVYAEDADLEQFEEEPRINEAFAQLKDHFNKK